MAKKRKRRAARRRRDFQNTEVMHIDIDIDVVIERIRWHTGRTFDRQEEAIAFIDRLHKTGEAAPFLLEPAPPERARALVAEAMEFDNPRQARILTKKALKIWPDCPDAHIMLGRLAHDAPTALDHYTRAETLTRRALGTGLDNPDSELWYTMNGALFLVSRQLRAQTLWQLGEQGEAMSLAREQLDLDPEDMTSIRYDLLSWLLELESFAEAHALLDRFEDRLSAGWQYARAFLLYQSEGPTRTASMGLQTAHQLNPFMAEMLVDPDQIDLPPHIAPHDLELMQEGVDFALRFFPLWNADPTAVDWLEETLGWAD